MGKRDGDYGIYTLRRDYVVRFVLGISDDVGSWLREGDRGFKIVLGGIILGIFGLGFVAGGVIL